MADFLKAKFPMSYRKSSKNTLALFPWSLTVNSWDLSAFSALRNTISYVNTYDFHQPLTEICYSVWMYRHKCHDKYLCFLFCFLSPLQMLPKTKNWPPVLCLSRPPLRSSQKQGWRSLKSAVGSPALSCRARKTHRARGSVCVCERERERERERDRNTNSCSGDITNDLV